MFRRGAPPPVNDAEKRRELAGLGLSDEQVDEYLAQRRAAHAPPDEVELFDVDAATAVQVFGRCQLAAVSTGAGVVFLGVAALEAEAAARACGVPFTAALLDDVAAVAMGAADVLNARAQA